MPGRRILMISPRVACISEPELVTAIGVGSQYKQHRAMPALPNWQPTQGRRWLLR